MCVVEEWMCIVRNMNVYCRLQALYMLAQCNALGINASILFVLKGQCKYAIDNSYNNKECN